MSGSGAYETPAHAVAFNIIGHDGGENGRAALDRDEHIFQVLAVPRQVAARVSGDIALEVHDFAPVSGPAELRVMKCSQLPGVARSQSIGAAGGRLDNGVLGGRIFRAHHPRQPKQEDGPRPARTGVLAGLRPDRMESP